MPKEKNEFVSFFKSSTDKNLQKVSVENIYQFIVSERYGELTDKYRYFHKSGWEKEASALKKRCEAFIASTLCEGGHAAKCIKSYTSLCMCDVDHIPEEKLDECFRLTCADPYVLLAYVTISGNGIRIIYRTDVADVNRHQSAFRCGNEYYARLLNQPYDEKCKNPNRLSFLCHDAGAYFNPNADVMKVPADKVKVVPGRPKQTKHITAGQTAAVVMDLLERHGKQYTEGHYNEYVSSALYLMNSYGVPREEAAEWAIATFADYDAAALHSIVTSVYAHTEEHGKLLLPKTKKNSSYASVGELKEFINRQCDLRYNVVLNRLQMRWKSDEQFTDITDELENSLWIRAEEEGIISSFQKLLAVMHSEFVQKYNPLREYLETLPDWDGHDYIGDVISRVHTATPELFDRYFRRWFVATVASMWESTIVNHTILVFIGQQGIFKTSFLSKLLPPELRRYFRLKTNNGRMTKDDLFTLTEMALICIEELDTMSTSEVNQLKAMVTMDNVNERPVYGRNKQYLPHRASFCATGNNRQFLTDDTGNRRWLPFLVLSVLSPFKHPLEYTQLYAQALSLYRNKFQYWFSFDEFDELYLHNQGFEAANIEMELISYYFRPPYEGEEGFFLPTAKIIERVSVNFRQKLSYKKIANAMTKLGFCSIRNKFVRGYIVQELTPAERGLIPESATAPAECSKGGQTELPF